MSDLVFDSHVVLRKSGRLRFTGALLAHVSSRRPFASRWAELALYRLGTVDGRISDDPAFILTRVGHSRIYHQDVCPDVDHHLPFGHELVEAPPPMAELVPCPTCAPVRAKAFDDPDFASTHRFEITKHNASVCRDTNDLLIRLMPPVRGDRARRDADPPHAGVSSLPWLSMKLLTDAAGLDPLIADLCTTEVRV